MPLLAEIGHEGQDALLLPWDLGTNDLTHEIGDLVGGGVAAEGSLGEDQFTIEENLEAPLGRGDQVDGRDDRRPSPK